MWGHPFAKSVQENGINTKFSIVGMDKVKRREGWAGRYICKLRSSEGCSVKQRGMSVGMYYFMYFILTSLASGWFLYCCQSGGSHCLRNTLTNLFRFYFPILYTRVIKELFFKHKIKMPRRNKALSQFNCRHFSFSF